MSFNHITVDIPVDYQQQYEAKNITQTNSTNGGNHLDIFNWCLSVQSKKEEFYNGNRNAFVNKLSFYCNDYGVPEETTLEECINRFQEPGFPANEIETAVKSAYRSKPERYASKVYEKNKAQIQQSNSLLPGTPQPSILERLQSHRFDTNKPIPEPVPVLSIEGNIISTNGNLTTFCGPSKAGKSGAISGILGGVLAIPGDIVDTVGITVQLNKEYKAVLHIDSEQSRYNHYKAMQGVLKRCSRSTAPEWFYSYSLREFEIKERIEAVKQVIENVSGKHNGVYLIFIDGIADFVNSVNDEEECNQVVHFFEKLAIQYNCPVVTILHFNPGTEKGRGHLGSQLERKSESVLSVTKDKDTEVSTIEGKFLRNAGLIPKVQFEYDKEKGYHVFSGIRTKQDDKQKKVNEWQELAEACFSEASTLTYKELCDNICRLENLKTDRSKQIVREMKANNLVEQPDKGIYKLLIHKSLPNDLIDGVTV